MQYSLERTPSIPKQRESITWSFPMTRSTAATFTHQSGSRSARRHCVGGSGHVSAPTTGVRSFGLPDLHAPNRLRRARTSTFHYSATTEGAGPHEFVEPPRGPQSTSPRCLSGRDLECTGYWGHLWSPPRVSPDFRQFRAASLSSARPRVLRRVSQGFLSLRRGDH